MSDTHLVAHPSWVASISCQPSPTADQEIAAGPSTHLQIGVVGRDYGPSSNEGFVRSVVRPSPHFARSVLEEYLIRPKRKMHPCRGGEASAHGPCIEVLRACVPGSVTV